MKTATFFRGLTMLILGALAVSYLNADSPKPASQLEPVEDDMHEFMEYSFEPFYKQLRQSMQAAPTDGKGWKPIKANSLVLAENGNLLMMRGPEDDTRARWNQLSVELRAEGKLLYQQAKKRDFAKASQHYKTFIAKCNACHKEFADGEHMLKP